MKAKTKSKKAAVQVKDLKPKSSPRGGNIGSQSSGAGAGKITFSPFK